MQSWMSAEAFNIWNLCFSGTGSVEPDTISTAFKFYRALKPTRLENNRPVHGVIKY